jgi:hypothetical protein
MMRTLTHEEELAMRKTAFKKLKPGILFDLSGERHFIVVTCDKGGADVVELDEKNRLRIVRDGIGTDSVAVSVSYLSFDEMSCLNVR